MGNSGPSWHTKLCMGFSILNSGCQCVSVVRVPAPMRHSGSWPSTASITLSISWAPGMRSGPVRRPKRHKKMHSSMSRKSCSRAMLYPKHSTRPARVVFLALSGPLIGRKELLKWQRAGIFSRSDMQIWCMSSDGALRKARINLQAEVMWIRVRHLFWMWAVAQDGLVNGTSTASQMGWRILRNAGSSSLTMLVPHGRGRIRPQKASGTVGM
mmetsp:Transcript_123708/g.321320  ORF Transcript_123708/g.321320 Transcript_123708/m.321320 type:complete len:212 (-) Transcript_123708:246-881(-)